MITLALINSLLVRSILGYSYLFKTIYLRDNLTITKNIDFFYGFIFLYLLSLIIHIFIPLKYASNFIILIGILTFTYGSIKKKIQINILLYFSIILLFSAISFSGSDNVDSPLYHLQILNWLTEYKLTFGMSNLQIRLGTNYPWYSVIALINFEFGNFSNKYYINLIIFSFILYEIITNKKNFYSLLFISLSFSYLFFYSLVHPFKYGIIMNHFGNPEKDIFNMLLFFIFIYFFIYLFENSKIKKLDVEKKNIINLVIITGILLLMQTQMYIFILPLVFFSILIFENYKIFSKLNFFLFVVVLCWMLKSFSISGCLFFPFTFTCFDTTWATEIDKIQYLKDETLRHNRSLPSKSIISDVHLTLETFKWFKYWFKDYYLTTSLHQINTAIFSLFFIGTIYLKIFSKKNILRFDIFLIISIFLINLTCLLNPEIRYAWGPHIALGSFLILILIKLIDYKNRFNTFIVSFFPVILILTFIFIKIPFQNTQDQFIKLPVRQHDMSNKKLIGTFNGYKVFSNGWKCADMKEICINIPRTDYEFKEKNSFLFIK